MRKLIDAYEDQPTFKNAVKLVRYLDKHMMAACIATGADAFTIEMARKHWEAEITATVNDYLISELAA
jgi:hypothetical protein